MTHSKQAKKPGDGLKSVPPQFEKFIKARPEVAGRGSGKNHGRQAKKRGDSHPLPGA